jgi:hypothetical protein
LNITPAAAETWDLKTVFWKLTTLPFHTTKSEINCC